MVQWSQLQKKTKTRWLIETANGLPKIKTLTLIRRQAMTSKIVTPKIALTKLPSAITVKKAERGYVDANGNTYSEKEIAFNRKNFVIEGQAETAKKAKKPSHKSSYTPSNKSLGSTVLGESAYTGQARTRYTAMSELVTRINEVAL